MGFWLRSSQQPRQNTTTTHTQRTSDSVKQSNNNKMYVPEGVGDAGQVTHPPHETAVAAAQAAAQAAAAAEAAAAQRN